MALSLTFQDEDEGAEIEQPVSPSSQGHYVTFEDTITQSEVQDEAIHQIVSSVSELCEVRNFSK